MQDSGRAVSMAWGLHLTDEVDDWLDGLAATDIGSHRQLAERAMEEEA